MTVTEWKAKLDSTLQEYFRCFAKEYMLVHYPAVHLLEDPIFKKYLGDAKFGKDALSSLIDTVYDLVKAKIKVKIAREKCVAMISDNWTRFGFNFFAIVSVGSNGRR
jgi:hypothetical protein